MKSIATMQSQYGDHNSTYTVMIKLPEGLPQAVHELLAKLGVVSYIFDRDVVELEEFLQPFSHFRDSVYEDETVYSVLDLEILNEKESADAESLERFFLVRTYHIFKSLYELILKEINDEPEDEADLLEDVKENNPDVYNLVMRFKEKAQSKLAFDINWLD